MAGGWQSDIPSTQACPFDTCDGAWIRFSWADFGIRGWIGSRTGSGSVSRYDPIHVAPFDASRDGIRHDKGLLG